MLLENTCHHLQEDRAELHRSFQSNANWCDMRFMYFLFTFYFSTDIQCWIVFTAYVFPTVFVAYVFPMEMWIVILQLDLLIIPV